MLKSNIQISNNVLILLDLVHTLILVRLNLTLKYDNFLFF